MSELSLEEKWPLSPGADEESDAPGSLSRRSGSCGCGQRPRCGPAWRGRRQVAGGGGRIRDRGAGGRACASSDSVAEWDGAQAIIERGLDEFGRIDILVNNAGIVRDRMIFKMSEEEFDTVIRTHLYGSFFCIRAASPSLREQGSGRIINITSTSGLIGNFGQANYAAAKLGIVALTKIAALDLKSKNVTANCIAPWAMTRLLGEVPDEVQDKRERSLAARPEQIAPLVCYLASDAAEDVNGQIFCVRGREDHLVLPAQAVALDRRE